MRSSNGCGRTASTSPMRSVAPSIEAAPELDLRLCGPVDDRLLRRPRRRSTDAGADPDVSTSTAGTSPDHVGGRPHRPRPRPTPSSAPGSARTLHARRPGSWQFGVESVAAGSLLRRRRRRGRQRRRRRRRLVLRHRQGRADPAPSSSKPAGRTTSTSRFAVRRTGNGLSGVNVGARRPAPATRWPRPSTWPPLPTWRS